MTTHARNPQPRQWPNCLGLTLLVLLAFSIPGGSAQANSNWKSLKGYSACGGIDQNGKLQAACGYERARYESKAVGKCPQGSFFDIGTWSCFSCPRGFNRNARPVTSPKACDKAVSPRSSRAAFHGKVKCPAGSFLDPRNGGECWQCPGGYGRTLAAVDQWNACGAFGKKAVSAEFKGRACPANGAFRDPRNGGECWTCPEDYQRTMAPVTAGNACQITLDFEPATKTAALTCPESQHFDFIDGGTCWSCPTGATRSVFGVKTGQACQNTKMKWVVPERGKYGLFGLGQGADDILAKLIAERTRIDEAAKAAAKISGEPEAQVIANAWKVIDSKPWDSPILSALLGQIVMDAAVKPAAERTASEKDLLAMAARLIQWNRQFIAYQAKQAYDTWTAASTKSYNEALDRMGAATIYAGSQIAPPDYNELVASSIQAGGAIAGPVGAVLISIFAKPVKAMVLPYRVMKAAQKAGEVVAASTTWTSASAAAAAAAPLMIAAGVSVILTMELDRIMAAEEAEGKIRQAITLADRPVDLGLLMQQKEGPDEFLFHWGSVIGADTRPSVTFKAKLASYKAGGSGEVTLQQKVAIATGTKPGTIITQVPKVQLEGDAVTVTKPGDKAEPALADQVEQAVAGQSPRPSRGAMRIEVSGRAGLCLTKKTGNSLAVTVGDCRSRAAMWLTLDPVRSVLVFAEKYCLQAAAPKQTGKEPVPLVVAECSSSRLQQWQLAGDGHVRRADSDQCLTLAPDRDIVLQACGAGRALQIFRPWAGR